MHAFVTVLLGLALLAPSPFFPQAKIKLILLGDSIVQSASAGSGKKVSDYTAAALPRHAEGEEKWSVVNRGLGRETARGAMRRIERILDEESPQVVTVAYGLVDSGAKDPLEFAANIRKLRLAVAGHDPRILLVLISTVPLDESIHAYGSDRFFRRNGGANRYINAEMNGRLREIAIEGNLPFVDLFRYLSPRPEWRAAIRDDGIHPDETGNRLIGDYMGRAYAARVLNDRVAGEKEEAARRLMRHAARLFFSRGFEAVEACAELEARAWNECPYLPEIAGVFSSLALSWRTKES
jgi:lysophospholipase L1-like esterase